MAAGPIVTTKYVTPPVRRPAPLRLAVRVKRTAELRAGRLRVFLLVVVLLLPLLLTSFGRH